MSSITNNDILYEESGKTYSLKMQHAYKFFTVRSLFEIPFTRCESLFYKYIIFQTALSLTSVQVIASTAH